MFRPMVPKVPRLGGTRTDLPLVDTKQPPSFRVLASGATVAHFAPSDEGNVLTSPLTPDCDVQVTGPGKPTQKGMELVPDLKSLGFPKKSHRSARSPLPL